LWCITDSLGLLMYLLFTYQSSPITVTDSIIISQVDIDAENLKSIFSLILTCKGVNWFSLWEPSPEPDKHLRTVQHWFKLSCTWNKFLTSTGTFRQAKTLIHIMPPRWTLILAEVHVPVLFCCNICALPLLISRSSIWCNFYHRVSSPILKLSHSENFKKIQHHSVNV